MPDWVVDTNVWAVSDGRHADISPTCQGACTDFVEELSRRGSIGWDDHELIISEYRANTLRGGRAEQVILQLMGEGRAEYVPVRVVQASDTTYADLAEYPCLTAIDPADRVFVAVALASNPKRPIVNASDPGWKQNRDALLRHGVQVQELCPEDVQRFST